MVPGNLAVHLAIAALAGIATAILGPAPVPAQNQATTTFRVTATAPVVCSVTSNNLNFGDYTGSPVDAVATTTVRCSDPATTWELGYDPGLHGTIASCAARRMRHTTSATGYLEYNIYRDAARQDTLGARLETRCFTHTGTGSANRNIFGRIAGGQTPAAGNYADTLTVTIYW